VPGPLPSFVPWRRRLRATLEDGVVFAALGALVALAMCSGCAAEDRDRQAEALDVVWRQAYERTDPPPPIVWVPRDYLSCTDPVSGDPGFPVWIADVGFTCRGGLFIGLVVLAEDPAPLSALPFAHELLHAAQARDFAFDPKHEGPAWQPGGKLERAVMLLEGAGL
jgi:hypothetical protein